MRRTEGATRTADMRALIVAGLALLAVACPAVAAPALIPWPATVIASAGTIAVRTGDRVRVPAGDAGAGRTARLAVALIRRNGGPALTVVESGPATIGFTRVTATEMAAEGYSLDAGRSGIMIAAAGDAGLFYGAMTLAQLLTPGRGDGGRVDVPVLAIRDAPRFAWRGVMLDLARHMLPIGAIRSVIDQMAQHKLNILQLHLTDDQGWRIEIKRFPELTRIGAWRAAPATGSAADGARYGGFYTQAELRDLVAYAAVRAITIVPEIDMPGHAQAAIAAYPAMGVFGDRPPVSAEWGINPYLFGVDEPSMAFVEGVLEEVLSIFPSRYIHVGGDEAIKDQWQASPVVQARMRALGIADEQHLQSWFIARIGTFLTARGRRLIGWDEILEGGLPPSASVMSWRGEAGAIEAARLGHDVVLSPGPTLYFDNLQSDRGDEPPGRLKIQTLADIYAYDPLPAAIPPDRAHHVLGTQANLWSEYLVTPAQIEHALTPRLDALAEIGWSPAATRDWPGFLRRLEPQMQRYRRQGFAVADSAFAPDLALAPDATAGRAIATLTRQVDSGAIRFTTDGREPTATSQRYTMPLTVAFGTTIRARTFGMDGVPLSDMRAFTIAPAALLTRDSARLDICPGPGIRLRVAATPDATAGPAYSLNIFDTCWIYRAAAVAKVAAIEVTIGRLARHYALREPQRRSIVWRYNPTRFGAVLIRAGGCDGPVVATLPIPDPAASPPQQILAAPLTVPGGVARRDLCIVTMPPEGGPIYAVESVRLRPGPIPSPATGAR